MSHGSKQVITFQYGTVAKNNSLEEKITNSKSMTSTSSNPVNNYNKHSWISKKKKKNSIYNNSITAQTHTTVEQNYLNTKAYICFQKETTFYCRFF